MIVATTNSTDATTIPKTHAIRYQFNPQPIIATAERLKTVGHVTGHANNYLVTLALIDVASLN